MQMDQPVLFCMLVTASIKSVFMKKFFLSGKFLKKFRAVHRKPGNFFPAKSAHALPRQPELFKTTQKPHKTPDSPT